MVRLVLHFATVVAVLVCLVPRAACGDSMPPHKSPITVFLVPHSHDDVGYVDCVRYHHCLHVCVPSAIANADSMFAPSPRRWTSTIKRALLGRPARLNSSVLCLVTALTVLLHTCVRRAPEYYDDKVQFIYDTITDELTRDPTRRFISVEQAFVQRWWNHPNTTSTRVRYAVCLLCAGGCFVHIRVTFERAVVACRPGPGRKRTFASSCTTASLSSCSAGGSCTTKPSPPCRIK